MANFVGLPAISVPAGEPLFHTPEGVLVESLGVLVERLLCAAALAVKGGRGVAVPGRGGGGRGVRRSAAERARLTGAGQTASRQGARLAAARGVPAPRAALRGGAAAAGGARAEPHAGERDGPASGLPLPPAAGVSRALLPLRLTAWSPPAGDLPGAQSLGPYIGRRRDCGMVWDVGAEEIVRFITTICRCSKRGGIAPQSALGVSAALRESLCERCTGAALIQRPLVEVVVPAKSGGGAAACFQDAHALARPPPRCGCLHSTSAGGSP
jgi:hypothetical protein